MVDVALTAGGRTQQWPGQGVPSQPTFGAALEVPLTADLPPVAGVAVVDAVSGAAVGAAELDLSVREEESGVQWLPLTLAGAEGPLGQVLVGWQYYHAEAEQTAAAEEQRRRRRCAEVYRRLLVRVVEARGLHQSRGARLSVEACYGEQRATTEATGGLSRRFWGEDLRFDVTDDGERLRLTLIQPAMASALGQVEVDLAGLPASSGDAWLDLQPPGLPYRLPAAALGLGQLRLFWAYSTDAEDGPAPDRALHARRLRKREEFSHVTVRAIGGRGLALDGDPAAALVVSLQFGPAVQRSSPVPADPAPCWLQAFDFALEEPAAQLTVAVWAEGPGGAEGRCLGYAVEDVM
eukprot:EG_transcript_18605